MLSKFYLIFQRLKVSFTVTTDMFLKCCMMFTVSKFCLFCPASLCNACGLRFLLMVRKEKQIPPNNDPKPIPLSFILN